MLHVLCVLEKQLQVQRVGLSWESMNADLLYKSLLVVLVNVVLALPPHEVARKGEHNGVHSAPSDENAKVYPQA
jgi:hypothetical protein